jgi:hypothetical protein
MSGRVTGRQRTDEGVVCVIVLGLRNMGVTHFSAKKNLDRQLPSLVPTYLHHCLSSTARTIDQFYRMEHVDEHHVVLAEDDGPSSSPKIMAY